MRSPGLTGTLRMICALTCLCLALSSCAGTREESGAVADAGKMLRYATATEPECLDPQVGGRDVDALIDRNIFDSLVSATEDGTFRPWLAESWTISEDRTTYTFRLRPGVRFQDGTPLDAAAVKATLDHAVDPKAKSFYAASLVGAYAGATIVDPLVIEVRLSHPSSPFLQALSTPYLGIQSPKSMRENAGRLCQKPVGSGPFGFVEWRKNTSVVLKRNPDYNWGPPDAKHTGMAKLKGITFSFVPENSVRLGSLMSGQVDAIGEVPTVNATTVAKALRLLRHPAPGAVYTIFLNSGSGPLVDERVRIALQRSLNLDQLIKALHFGQYDRAWSVLGPTTVAYDRTVEGSWKYDPKLANRLLDEAGWTGRDAAGYRTKDGRRLTLVWPYAKQLSRDGREFIGQGIAADARRVGFDVRFEREEPGALNTQLASGKGLDMFAMSFVRSEPDILRYFFASDQTVNKGGGNLFRVADPQLDRWFRDATTDNDTAARRQSFEQAQQYIRTHALAIPVYVPKAMIGTSKKLHDVGFAPDAYPLFYDAWLGAGR
ncbi:ABC transporter substrate-binding protein [Embleya sp. NPDC020630]|uniref:ABC transporter substrate-binding protein n=1 Tax=Embleya sp. NPDC020630 TaxID=3363979 RepID=UPI00379E5037